MSLDIANTVLNASPYFDDYSEDKKFHRVLFRPAVAVQARELNQVQSIFQNQIERFGNHVFKDGSIVKGCGLTYLTDIDYISIADQFVVNTSLSSTNNQFVNCIAIGNTTGVVAQIIAAREGFSATSTPARFFVKYTQPGTAGERVFDEGEYINLYQPGKSYLDKVIVKITSASEANSQNFPTGARLINESTKARGFIANAYANASGDYVELRNVRKSFNINDSLVLSTDSNITATVNNLDYIYFANSYVDSVRALVSNADLYTSRGFAYGAAVSPGVVFHKGHFIKVDSHLVIVNENTRDPAGKVLLFNTSEDIVTENDDSSLYDNASGTPNLNAPGAHRLKLSAILVAKDKVDISNTDIAFPIVEFSNTGPIFERTNTQYNIIGEELAKRTYEESGHYIVKPFNVSTKPDAANTDGLIYDVTQGLAYVKGKRVEVLNNLAVSGRRGTDSVSLREIYNSMAYGNYVVVSEVKGYFPVDQSVEIRLYDATQTAITSGRLPSASAPSGNLIGYANVRAVKFVENGDYKGSTTAQYRLYIFNVRMNDGKKFGIDTKSFVYYNSSTSEYEAFADAVLVNSIAAIKESSQTPLIFGLNARALKNLRDKDGVYDTNYVYTAANTTAVLGTDGTITFGIGSQKGILGFSQGDNTTELLYDVIVKDANVTSAVLTGTVSASATNVLTGTSTTFTNDFVPGDCIKFVGSGAVARVVTVTSNTSMTVNSAVSVTANTIQRLHLEGSAIAMNPSTGTKRSTSIAVNRETATIAMGDSYIASGNVIVRFQAYNNEAAELKKQVRRKSVVVINTSNNVGGSTGPWNLGVPDVFRLTGVYFGTNTSNFATTTNRIADFNLDPGQRDDQYDHASIALSPKSDVQSLANTFMLVEFDCFTANNTTGEGYFCIESYPVNDSVNANTDTYIKTWEIPAYYSSGAQKLFDLRDVLDFRPYKSNTANVTSSYTTATTNPARSNTFNSITTSYNPVPGSTSTTNLTYYVGRKDRLVLTPDGLFKVDEGLADAAPKLPQLDPDSLSIAEVDVPPYPSLTDIEKITVGRTDYNTRLNLLSHRRYTMKDISTLEQRIQRLEYYTTLNMLEKVALQTNISGATGIARFQNGFFVDPFNSHVYGKTSDPGYRIAIDERNGLLRPAFHPENIEVEFDTDTNSYSNVRQTGDVVTLDYTEEEYIEQPYASAGLNVSGTPLKWAGTIDTRPSRTSDVEYLAQPAAISSTSGIARAYSSMVSITPGVANYGWWRESTITSDEYQIMSQQSDTRDQTSIPMETTKFVSTQDGQSVTTGIQFLARERVFAFKAVGLKPSTTHYLFIDNTDNSQLAALGELSSTPNASDESFVERTTQWGTPLTTDTRGELIGKFIIPALAVKTGTHRLTVRNRNTLTSGVDESYAEAYFTIDVTTVDPPVIIESSYLPPPDSSIALVNPVPTSLSGYSPNPTGEEGSIVPGATSATDGTLSGATSNYDIRVSQLPDMFARFSVSGNTTIVGSANATFSLTFTNDSLLKTGNIASYEWDFGAVDGLIVCSSNTATGVGPHTITYNLQNSVEDVKVSLTITDNSVVPVTSTYTTVIRLAKLPRISELAVGGTPTNPEGMDLFLTPTVFNQISDWHSYRWWRPNDFDAEVKNSINVPEAIITYDSATSLGTNTVLKIVANPAIDYQGNVVWTKTYVSGASLPQITYANVTSIYVNSSGTGYSNTDKITLSNGSVNAIASIRTDSTGAIQYARVLVRGNMTNAAAVTPDTFSGSGACTQFTLSASGSNTSAIVSINGVLQTPYSDYTIVGTTLTFSTAPALSDAITVVNTLTGGVGTLTLTASQLKTQVSSLAAPANSTNGNTSAGSGASFYLIMGETSNGFFSNAVPRVTNDVLTLYSNSTPGVETKILVKADFQLSNGYANSIGNTQILVTLKNANTIFGPSTTWHPEYHNRYGRLVSSIDSSAVGVYTFGTSDVGSIDPKYSSDSSVRSKLIKLFV